MSEENTYKIVRYYANLHRGQRTLLTGLTLEEAKEHCNNPETSSATAVSRGAEEHTKTYGAWFDGWAKE